MSKTVLVSCPSIGDELTTVPYFSQWESRNLASAIIAGEHDLCDDPLWEQSGAQSAEEYALWASHICGMACLKMVLAAKTGVIHPTFRLMEHARMFGAYVAEETGIRGMIYAPFNQMMISHFGIHLRIPRPSGHLFHEHPATDSTVIRPPIPRSSGHP